MGKLGRIVGGSTAALVIATGAVAADGAGKHSYRAAMTAAAEVPRSQAPAGATGTFTATVTGSGASRSITWKLTFARLSGPAAAAHIHRARTGKAGPVVLALCGPCTSGKRGAMKIPSATADLLERGLAYVNVHTAKNQAGEIRGQLKPAGEDSTATAPPKGNPTPSTPPPSPPAATTPDGGGYY